MRIILDVVLVVLLVDFVSGLMHWLEDSYGDPDWPIIGPLITAPNVLHHHRPMAFTKNSWLSSASVIIFFAAVMLAVAWLVGCLTWQVLLFAAIGINANEIHKWNHLPEGERPRLVVILQRLRILQRPAHHARHHTGSKNTNYCVITDWVNPVLEAVHFWRRLEQLVALVFGVHPRPDPSVAPRYRASGIASSRSTGEISR